MSGRGVVISIIVAADEHGGIGWQGRLPWHLPDDLKRFKALTMGRPIVMGRKTWESIGRPLPGRLNIVITRQPGFHAEGARTAGSLAEALAVAGGAEEVFVIGGAEIYALALPLAGRIHLTRVHATFDSDARFPPLDETVWEEVAREDRPVDARHAFPCSFIELRRRAAALQ
ncbi:MAG TPA: dihydrofolate reductase [Steroidobacteraceae bacterium]|nr:dihydrofolate reductase [Steroidobacteraceae bacterium]